MNYVLCTHEHFERTARETPLKMSEEMIAFWFEIYRANPMIALLGISFEMFLVVPEKILPTANFTTLIPLSDELLSRLPLLPKQRAVQERLNAADAGQMAFDLDPQLSPTGECNVEQA